MPIRFCVYWRGSTPWLQPGLYRHIPPGMVPFLPPPPREGPRALRQLPPAWSTARNTADRRRVPTVIPEKGRRWSTRSGGQCRTPACPFLPPHPGAAAHPGPRTAYPHGQRSTLIRREAAFIMSSEKQTACGIPLHGCGHAACIGQMELFPGLFPLGEQGRFHPVADLQFLEDVGHVMLDRLLGKLQTARDLLVALS